ncbi:MAG TPA: 3'(2'),5'-bisphosphate nucleotidase CysQ [Streptosporangiaceae bacterium]|nr:3'(2'),5'-bisphosphate nucleotidase CysQ [Streptosporangiaceae bacterium]
MLIVDDDHLAHELATEAGRRLLDLRDGADFGDQAALRAAGDLLSHEFLTAALAAHRQRDALLSEESEDDPVRLKSSRVWIVDPLDGTREFGEEGRTDWAVHVALWERGDLGGAAGPPRGRLVAGAVALPAQGRTFSTVATGTSGDANGQNAGGPTGVARLKMVVSRTRPPGFVRRLAAGIGADLIPLGSAGAKIIAVVSGAADAYVHSGGMYEWDSAAPVAVAAAAGLHASRIDGRPLAYNQPDPRLPDILVCRSAIAAMMLAAIRSAGGADGPARW